MINLLLLSAGTNACYHAAKVIKKKFGSKFCVIGADINDRNLVATSKYLDNFFQVPLTETKEYYQVILNICKNEKVDFVLPSFDADQNIFYPENPDLCNLSIKSLSTSKDALKFYKNKQEMFSFLKDNGISVPNSYLVKDIKVHEDYFIKPKIGCGSVGAEKIKGNEILKIPNIANYIIQEVCFNPEYTVEC
jgi:carbamoyl-phosphate synthase large subunit